MPREMDMDNLTDDDKDWLRSWNRQDEIPNEEPGVQTVLIPGDPPGGETNPANPDSPVTSSTADDPFNGEEPPEDYNDWTRAQLQHELGSRQLPKNGKTTDLVSRLEEDDAQREDSEDNQETDDEDDENG